jgi:hypothetical protein
VLAHYGTTCWLLHVTTFYYSLAIVLMLLSSYLRDMHNRNKASDSNTTISHLSSSVWGAIRPIFLMRSALGSIFAILAMVTMTMAADPPDAPSSVARADEAVIEAAVQAQAPKFVMASAETKVIDKTFVGLALISTGSTFADSYTTLFARQNWLAGKKGVCNIEVQSPYLYGTHPTVGRAYAVASAKSVGSVLAAYYFRKHHHKFWSVPLVVNSVVSLQGVGQNMATCN